MAKSQPRKRKAAAVVAAQPMAGRRLELTKQLYALAGKPDKAEEFERVRLELAGLK